MSGVRVVKGFGAEGVQQHRFQSEADDVYDESMKATRVRAVFLPALELLPNIGLVAVLGYGGHQVLDGHLTLGALVAFNVYVVMLIWPLRMLGMILAQSQRAIAAAERVAELLETEPEIVDGPDAIALPAGPGEVRFENVTFGYSEAQAHVGARRPRPRDRSRHVGRARRPHRQRQDHGRPADPALLRHRRRPHPDRRRRRARREAPRPAPRRRHGVRGHVPLQRLGGGQHRLRRSGCRPTDRSSAPLLAGAHDFIAGLPLGYDTEIGERGFSLSGGQRQRIAIARAILADPRVLILDDATSSVDPTKEHEIRDALTEVMRGRTTIVIAHRPATIALADRVVLLDEGRIVADGTHTELLATCERYREVLASALAIEAA